VMAAGDCLIVRRSDLLKDIRESEGFKVDVIYVTPQFITIATPQSNYGTRGALSLFNNPIMHLTP
ncbi:AraC family transcriptional regulator, partial [Parabacteroides distasonis]